MDAELYRESIQYERLTQSIYQAILKREGVNNITVERDVNIKGRSGVDHQIDVFWKFKQATIEHTVLIECKNYSSAITLEKVRNLFAVIHDIGNCIGLMVTKTGYQSGASEFAKYYGISLKLLRKPTDDDWKGIIKEIRLRITAKAPVSTFEKPISTYLVIESSSDDQKIRLDNLKKEEKLHMPSGPDIKFFNSDGEECTEEMRWWLPKNLNVLDKDDGGPYEQTIILDEKYIYINRGEPSEELVKAACLKVQFYVETLDSVESVIHGEEIVQAILKDYATGNVEYVKRK
ncbi:MAG: restriction endonuclease [Thermodesulfobacteriota bacterium]